MKIEVSNGEIIDKLTIIRIKIERIKDESKLFNLRKEFDVLKHASLSILDMNHPLYQELYEVNCKLWDIEDQIRDLDRNGDFGEAFVQTARSVYLLNDKRSLIKREINLKTSSGLTEEKSYKKY
jgi:Family of unknown function (DUF6165)